MARNSAMGIFRRAIDGCGVMRTDEDIYYINHQIRE